MGCLKSFQHVPRRGRSSLNVLRRMRSRNEPRFKLGWRQINALLQHPMKIFGKAWPIALHRISKVVHRFGREISTKHRAAAVELYWRRGGSWRFYHLFFL